LANEVSVPTASSKNSKAQATSPLKASSCARSLRRWQNTITFAAPTGPGLICTALAAPHAAQYLAGRGRIDEQLRRAHGSFLGEGAYHTGVDISTPIGVPALATADGIVTFADRKGGYGRLVTVDHGNGFETCYAHLSRFEVIVGQEIRQGEPVGAVGASGRATAPHLHYEVRVRKIPVNPYRFLSAKAMAQQAKVGFPF